MKKLFKHALACFMGMAIIASSIAVMPMRAKAAAWNGSDVVIWTKGDGTSASTAYQISTAAQLAYLAQQADTGTSGTSYSGVYFKLTADIDLGNYNWTPIGELNKSAFAGTFDGLGHKITGLKIDTTTSGYFNDGTFNTTYYYQGLFGNVSGTVKNLGIEGTAIHATKCGTGAIAGVCLAGGTISNCYSTGSVYGEYVQGGLVGENDGNVINCYSSCTVTSSGTNNQDTVGGLVGLNNGKIMSCHATGNVTGDTTNISASLAGGCVGQENGYSINSYATGTVTAGDCISGNYTAVGGYAGTGAFEYNCYATGNVTGGKSVDAEPTDGICIGGFCGSENSGTIVNCYSTGSVTGNTSSYPSYFGGFTGYLYESSITNCYWNNDTISSDVGGIDTSTTSTKTNVTGLSSAVMKGEAAATSITYSNDTSTGTGTTTSFVDALENGRGAVPVVAGLGTAYGWAVDSGTTKVNGGYPIIESAYLSNLGISDGTLNETFSGTTYAYTATVDAANITVIPTAEDGSRATVNVTANGATSTVASGSASGSIALSADSPTVITVTVKSFSGTGTETYALSVNRAVPVTSATITGTAQVGTTLTAIVNAGATNVTYQWKKASSAEGSYAIISGATSPTYTPVADDAGKFIEVVISGDSFSSKTSNPTSAVTAAPAAGNITVTGNPSKTYDGSAVTDPAVNKNGSGGVVSYTYYNDNGGVAGTTPLSGAPSATGTYWVKASMAADSNHTAAEAIKKFTISSAAGSITITGNPSKIYDGSAVTDPAINKNGSSGAVSYTYYNDNSGVIGTTPLSGAPSAGGTYWVKASMAADSNYTAAEANEEFTISPAAGSITITGDPSKTYDGSAVTDPAVNKKWKQRNACLYLLQ